MIPLIASAALGGLGSIAQLLQARKQKRLADGINPIRPTHTPPAALQESVQMARQSANATLPGLGAAVNRLQSGTSNAVRSAQLTGNPNAALAVIGAAQAHEADSMNDLATSNAGYQAQQQANLQQQLNGLAQAQDQAWDFNHRQKFLEESQAKAGLTQASIQNMHSGINGLANVGLTMLGGLQKKKMQDQNHINNLSGYHRSQLGNMRNTPLFGGLQSRFGL